MLLLLTLARFTLARSARRGSSPQNESNLGERLSLLDRALDVTDHIEGLFRKSIVLSVENLSEAANRVFEPDIDTGRFP